MRLLGATSRNTKESTYSLVSYLLFSQILTIRRHSYLISNEPLPKKPDSSLCILWVGIWQLTQFLPHPSDRSWWWKVEGEKMKANGERSTSSRADLTRDVSGGRQHFPIYVVLNVNIIPTPTFTVNKWGIFSCAGENWSEKDPHVIFNESTQKKLNIIR